MQAIKSQSVKTLSVTGVIISAVEEISKNVIRFSVMPKPKLKLITNEVVQSKEPIEVILKGSMASAQLNAGTSITVHGRDLSKQNLGKPCLLYTGFNLADKLLLN